MIREIFEQRLAALSPRQEAETTALVEEYVKDVREVQNTAVRYATAPTPDAFRALSLIARLGETAVETLAGTIAAQDPVLDTWLLFELAKGVAFAETAATGRLRAALSDTRMVPQPPEMRYLEEVGPPYRVCDEAYVALRRILNPESFLQHLMESRHFLSLPDTGKNHEIESWLQTSSFTRFLGDVDEEEK
ncbi:MAG: hypothetical protein A2559_00775 [Deltaproteobacteria bacterium RIFOXYD2_FULL_66_9]|nr:MAG: hypothetical protein A2559_00775 [Deltaproteobacteria bacterium RIFOXYD2_FULL_66_9]